jgi:hypothetical protein
VRTLTTSAPLQALRAVPPSGPEGPRVVPPATEVVDAAFERYRLFTLSPVGVPHREGVALETTCVGVGHARRPTLDAGPGGCPSCA